MSHSGNDEVIDCIQDYVENDAFWQQVDDEEKRRFQEEVLKDYEEHKLMVNQGLPWWHLIDQDEGWIMKVTK